MVKNAQITIVARLAHKGACRCVRRTSISTVRRMGANQSNDSNESLMTQRVSKGSKQSGKRLDYKSSFGLQWLLIITSNN